jgi:DNA-binding CsgD family transcriptional regulator
LIHLSSSAPENASFAEDFNGIHTVQVNIVATEALCKPARFQHSSKVTLFYYIVGSEKDIHCLTDDLLKKLNIDFNEGLLSKRELDVLKTLNCFSTTKQAAAKLHISERTLNNHRYNISRKTGINAVALSSIVFQTDNIALVSAILK